MREFGTLFCSPLDRVLLLLRGLLVSTHPIDASFSAPWSLVELLGLQETRDWLGRSKYIFTFT